MRDELDMLVKKMYPEGVYCKKCAKITKHSRITTRKSYACNYCGLHFHPLANTIFHKSSTPLLFWLYALNKLEKYPEYPATKLARAFGVTYKTAWRMKKRILETGVYDTK